MSAAGIDGRVDDGTASSPESVSSSSLERSVSAAGIAPSRRLGRVSDLEEDDGDVVLAAARFAASTSARAATSSSSLLGEQRDDLAVGDHVGEPVGAEQEDVAGLGLDGERVDVDVGLGADRARDHGALRVRLGLLRRELAAAHELADERVVLRQLLELAVADAVGARVADVAEGDRAARAVDERTVIVVPMPDAAASSFERWKTRRFASWISSTTRSSPRSSPSASSSTAAARPDATSPAWAPPIPSATAKSGGSQT